MERRIIFIDRSGQAASHQPVDFTTHTRTRREKESYPHLHTPIYPLAPLASCELLATLRHRRPCSQPPETLPSQELRSPPLLNLLADPPQHWSRRYSLIVEHHITPIRCVQMFHVTKMVTDQMSLRWLLAVGCTVHHSPSRASGSGILSGICHSSNTACQTSLATTQPMRRCSMVSSTWSQRGHRRRCCKPRLLNLSALQHRFFATSKELEGERSP